MELKNVTIEKENSIAVISINRPEALNALNSETLSDISSAAKDVLKDPEIQVVIVTGVATEPE